MRFLARHIEKLVLGVALAGLLASCYYLLQTYRAAETRKGELKSKRDSAVSHAGAQGRIATPELPVGVELPNAPVTIEAPEKSAGGLLEPARVIVCVNEDCGRLLPYESDTCQFTDECGIDQPPRGDEADGGDEDYDRDGIPDYVEDRYAFLSPANPRDAVTDGDRDGFSNVEEFRAKTEMDNAESIPSLIHATRVANILRKDLPIQLKKVSDRGKDDKAKWSIYVELTSAKGKRKKSLRFGDDPIGGFSIDEVTKQGAEEEPATLTVTEVKTGETYTLVAKETSKERETQAQLIFLTQRDPRYFRRFCKIFWVQEGDSFTLTHPVTEDVQEFTVASLDAETISVSGLDADQQAKETVEIKRFNNRRDFIPGVGFMRTAQQSTGGPAEGRGPGTNRRRGEGRPREN